MFHQPNRAVRKRNGRDKRQGQRSPSQKMTRPIQAVVESLEPRLLLSGYSALERPTELQYWDSTRADNGYNFFGAVGTSYLLDMEGRVLHTWPVGTNPHLLSNGDVLDAMTEALLTQNSQITEILSRVSITPIQAIVMVQPGGAITLEQYSSYRSERGNPLPIQNSGGWPDLTGADVHLWIARQQAGTPVMPPIIDIAHGSVQGTLSVPTGVKFDIPSANTALLSNYTKRGYAYCLVAYYSSNGDQVPITDWADCTAMPGIALAS